MYFDRWDICQAYYCYFSLYHNGQWSIEYERLCKMGKYYHSGHRGVSEQSLSDNAREIYKQLLERNGIKE